VKQNNRRDTTAISTMASRLAKEAESASTAGSNWTGSDGGSGENKCGDGTPTTKGRVCTMKSIYHEGR